MRVGILGPLEVNVDGQTVRVGGGRLRAFLVRLALDAGRVVTVGSLSDALWADDDTPADPLNALQTLVSRLRRVLPPEAEISWVHSGYRLEVPPGSVDALRFEELAQEGRRALRNGRHKEAGRLLGEGLGLWRGTPLADVATAPFTQSAAARLEELRLTVIEDWAEAELGSGGDLTPLVPLLRETAAEHRLRERLHSLYITALHFSGRRAEALSAYNEVRACLCDELGADPGTELQQAHLTVLRDQPTATESVYRRPQRPKVLGNLRVSLTSFVGRDDKLRQIDERFGEGRLVTLVGPAGAGKTRLAIASATHMAERFPDGIWLVELASVTDPSDVRSAVSETVGIRAAGLLDVPAAHPDMMSRLVEVLSTSTALIVLDNCEHLIGAVAEFAEELLGRCPRLSVLITSRESLLIPGEVLCPVPPLGLPSRLATPAEAATAPSVRLFTERAMAVRPDFRLTDDTVAAVVEICRRLDGLPLAIELAAARLRSLTAEQLATHLGNRFALLTGGSRTALPRHRTLQAAVAWSWDLLAPGEREFTQRLAVFPSTITADAAAHVGGAGAAALDMLADLVDRSLLQQVEGAEPRYRMLETIREFGLERLGEAGGQSWARAAHAAYFLSLAEQAEPYVRGGEQDVWIRRLASEHDSLLAALRYTQDSGDGNTALRLGAALALFWTIEGNHAEAAQRLRSALDLTTDDDLAGARTAATAFYLINGIRSDGLSPPDMGEVGGPLAGLTEGPMSTVVVAARALLAGDCAAGLRAIERALPEPDPWMRAILRLLQAWLHGHLCDVEGMDGSLTAAAADFEEAQEHWGTAEALMFLAHPKSILGDFDGAIAALEKSIRLMGELRAGHDLALQRIWLADVRAQAGDMSRARAELLALLPPKAGSVHGRHVAHALIVLGNISRWEKDLQEAERHYDAAGRQLDRLPAPCPQFRALLHTSLGQLALAADSPEAAQRHLRQAVVRNNQAPDLVVSAGIAVGIAELGALSGEPATASRVLGAAHMVRGAPDTAHPDVVRVTERLRTLLGQDAFDAAYALGRDCDAATAHELIEEQVHTR